MDKKALAKMLKQYEIKAERAEYRYQNTGESRYNSERERCEDVADGLRLALFAADEHNEFIGLRTDFAKYGCQAQEIVARGNATGEADIDALWRLAVELSACARLHGLIEAKGVYRADL